MSKGFMNKENLKNALESSDFLKEINMTSYDDIKDRENKDSIILREQMYEITFLIKGKNDVVVVNVACKYKRTKMRIIRMSKHCIFKANEFLKGGVNESKQN